MFSVSEQSYWGKISDQQNKILQFILLTAWVVIGTSCTLQGTQYTHHYLKYMLPQHCITYNDVFLLIISTKV
jgi:hypothetical protein